MSAAILTILGDASGVKRAFGETVADARRASAAISAESRRASAKERQEAASEAAMKRQLQRQEYQDKVRSIRDKQRVEEAARKAREKAAAQEVAGAKKAESEKTKAAARESSLRQKLADKEAKASERDERAKTRAAETEERNRTRLAEAEAKQRQRTANRIRQQEEREEIASNRRQLRAQVQARRRADRETVQRGRTARRETNRFFSGAPAAAAGAPLLVGAQFADYGDDLRGRRRARENVTTRAQQIASGDIGDVRAAPEILRATENVSRLTGLDPQGVVEAIGDAQANFSNLADAASRGSYLGTVLPMLGRAAVATNSSLEDMVSAAGEFQRQLHISNADLPAAISRAIAEGRLGSIGFRDYAAHAGTLAGAASRSFSPAEADAPRTQALVGGLFQFAGRAGGGGGEAATRAQAFFNNLSSDRGQRALREGLGYNPFDAMGQIATRQGETQVDAFQRIVQDAYRRSGGNAGRFLDTVAGRRDESRSLGDQLFRDLSEHGGRLAGFRSNIDQALGATTESAVDAPFNAISRSPAIDRARREVGDFWRQSGAASDFAGDTERQREEFARQHPFIARLQDQPVSRAAFDVTNFAYNAPAAAPELAPGASRRARQLALARDIATQDVRNDIGPERIGTVSPATLAPIIEERTRHEFARLQLADQARAAGQSPMNISEESINRLAAALRGAPLVATIAPHDAALASAGPSSAAMPPTP